MVYQYTAVRSCFVSDPLLGTTPNKSFLSKYISRAFKQVHGFQNNWTESEKIFFQA